MVTPTNENMMNGNDTNLVLDNDDLEKFQRDGFIVKRNILDANLVNEICQVGRMISDLSQKSPYFFDIIERGAIFDGAISSLLQQQADEHHESNGDNNDKDKKKTTTTTNNNNSKNINTYTGSLECFNTTCPKKVFRDVAIYSKLPQIVAQLMRLNPKTQNVRILRDVFLSKGIEKKTCDWHVDDQGFWPESFLSTASEESGIDQDGVNVWIALDDMPIEYQGSMAVSAGSHQASWRFDAYEGLGQDRSQDGGAPKEVALDRIRDHRKNGSKIGTCSIGQARPEVREKIEESNVVLDIRRGDIIFATRRLFHRTTEVTEAGLSYYSSLGIQALNRYSIRYTPGTAKLPNGWSLEWSTVSDSKNSGKSLDDIVTNGTILWYPKVWPEIDENIDKRLDFVATKELKGAKEKANQGTDEIRAIIGKP